MIMNDMAMNADEKEIYEMLKAAPDKFLSMREISKRLGRGRLFEQDRNWTRPILLRMEMDGLLDSNSMCEYRLSQKSGNTTSFFKAIEVPGICLGEVTIIAMDEAEPAKE